MNQVRIPSTWLAMGLVLATVWVFSPFWPSLLLALWLGLAGLQVMPRLTRWLRGREGLAATCLMVAVVLVAIPIVALLFSVALVPSGEIRIALALGGLGGRCGIGGDSDRCVAVLSSDRCLVIRAANGRDARDQGGSGECGHVGRECRFAGWFR